MVTAGAVSLCTVPPPHVTSYHGHPGGGLHGCPGATPGSGCTRYPASRSSSAAILASAAASRASRAAMRSSGVTSVTLRQLGDQPIDARGRLLQDDGFLGGGELRQQKLEFALQDE